jgi:hypothetical protein
LVINKNSLLPYHLTVLAKAAEDKNTRHRRWTTAELSHIRLPFNCQRRIAFFSFTSVSPLPVCLLRYFLPNADLNFELPDFNVFVLPLDLAFVLNITYFHILSITFGYARPFATEIQPTF